MNAASFCKNYARLCFDAKRLQKGLNRVDEIFGSHFQKKCCFWPILNVAEITFKVYNTYFSFQFYNLVVLKVYLLVEVRSFKIFSQRQL